ncbi:MAG TPA: hypothetical protein VI112_07110 [Bacteroidia bacterium]|jgi:hypothetical protein
MRYFLFLVIAFIILSCNGTKGNKEIETYRVELPAGYRHIVIPFDASSKKRILQFPNYGNVLIEIYEGIYMDSGVIVHSKPLVLLKPNDNDSIQLDVTAFKPGLYRMDYNDRRFGSRFVLDFKLKDDH